jgi:hypothetical protein
MLEPIEIKDLDSLQLFQLDKEFFDVGHEIWRRHNIIQHAAWIPNINECEAVLELKKLIDYSDQICKKKNELLESRTAGQIKWNNDTQRYRDNFLKEYPWIQEYEEHKNGI